MVSPRPDWHLVSSDEKQVQLQKKSLELRSKLSYNRRTDKDERHQHVELNPWWSDMMTWFAGSRGWSLPTKHGASEDGWALRVMDKDRYSR